MTLLFACNIIIFSRDDASMSMLRLIYIRPEMDHSSDLLLCYPFSVDPRRLNNVISTSMLCNDVASTKIRGVVSTESVCWQKNFVDLSDTTRRFEPIIMKRYWHCIGKQ